MKLINEDYLLFLDKMKVDFLSLEKSQLAGRPRQVTACLTIRAIQLRTRHKLGWFFNADLKQRGGRWWEPKHCLPPIGVGWNHLVFPLRTFRSTASLSGLTTTTDTKIEFNPTSTTRLPMCSLYWGLLQVARCDGQPLVETPHDLGKNIKPEV